MWTSTPRRSAAPDDCYVPMNEGIGDSDGGSDCGSVDTADLLDRASILSGSPRRRQNNNAACDAFRDLGGRGSSPRSRQRRHRQQQRSPPPPWNNNVVVPKAPLPPGPIGSSPRRRDDGGSGGRGRAPAAVATAAGPPMSPVVLAHDPRFLLRDASHQSPAVSVAASPRTSPRGTPWVAARSPSSLGPTTPAAGTTARFDPDPFAGGGGGGETGVGGLLFSALEVTPVVVNGRPATPMWPRRRLPPSPPPQQRAASPVARSSPRPSPSWQSCGGGGGGGGSGGGGGGRVGVVGGGRRAAAASPSSPLSPPPSARPPASPTARLRPAQVREFLAPRTPNFYNSQLEPVTDPQRWWELLQLRRSGDETVHYDPDRALPATVAAAFDAACLRGDVPAVQRHYCVAAFGRAVEPGTGWNHMHRASKDNDAKLLSVLLELGAPADIRDSEGRTALHLAVGTGALAALRVLIFEGGRRVHVDAPDAEGRTALHLAAALGRVDCAALLLGGVAPGRGDRGVHPSPRRRPSARRPGGSSGGDGGGGGRGSSPVAVAGATVGGWAGVRCRDRLGRTPLLEACACGHAALVKVLLGARARLGDVDNAGDGCLELAAHSGDLACVRYVVEAGTYEPSPPPPRRSW